MLQKYCRLFALCVLLISQGASANGIVKSIVKAPVASDGTTAGAVTDFVINLDTSLDPAVDGRTLLEGNTIRITLPAAFENVEGFDFGAPGSICGPPLSGDECNTGVLLQGWPQHPIGPPAAKYSIGYEAATNTIVFTALEDLVPDSPLEPGIKQIHLILLGFVNPRPGRYRVFVEAETGPGGAVESGWGKLKIIPKIRPSINITSTGSDNPTTLNTIYQQTTVGAAVPLLYNVLLWNRKGDPLDGAALIERRGNGTYLLKKGRRAVGHARIDAPDGAIGHTLVHMGESVSGPTPVFGPPSETARLVLGFMAGSEEGRYTITLKLTGGNKVRFFVDVTE